MLGKLLALKFGPATGVVSIDHLSIVVVVSPAALLLGEALSLRKLPWALFSW